MEPVNSRIEENGWFRDRKQKNRKIEMPYKRKKQNFFLYGIFLLFDILEGVYKMEQNLCVKGTKLIVYMPEEVDHMSADDLRRAADRAMRNPDIRHIIFDFSDTLFMDSSGIGMMMGRYRKIIKRGGDMMAVNTNRRIEKILLLSGIQKLIPIKQTRKEGDCYGDYQ